MDRNARVVDFHTHFWCGRYWSNAFLIQSRPIAGIINRRLTFLRFSKR
jgi:hypothetical protein